MTKKRLLHVVIGVVVLVGLYLSLPLIFTLLDYRESQLYQIRNDIDKIINISATDASQCMSIGFGDRSCGGVDEYLIYSSASTNEEELFLLVSKYNKLDAENNDENGYLSICSIESVPELVLENGKCTEKQSTTY